MPGHGTTCTGNAVPCFQLRGRTELELDDARDPGPGEGTRSQNCSVFSSLCGFRRTVETTYHRAGHTRIGAHMQFAGVTRTKYSDPILPPQRTESTSTAEVSHARSVRKVKSFSNLCRNRSECALQVGPHPYQPSDPKPYQPYSALEANLSPFKSPDPIAPDTPKSNIKKRKLSTVCTRNALSCLCFGAYHHDRSRVQRPSTRIPLGPRPSFHLHARR
eukprot:3508792-Rhodomonas_salina.1